MQLAWGEQPPWSRAHGSTARGRRAERAVSGAGAGQTGPESREQGGGGAAGTRSRAGEKGEGQGEGETPEGTETGFKGMERALGRWSGWT